MAVRADHSDREITRRVIAARETAGLKQADLADRLGLSKQAYNPYEKNITPFTVQQLFQLSHILNRSVEYFLGLDTGLRPDEDQLLTIYRHMPEDQRRRILRMIEAAADEE